MLVSSVQLSGPDGGAPTEFVQHTPSDKEPTFQHSGCPLTKSFAAYEAALEHVNLRVVCSLSCLMCPHLIEWTHQEKKWTRNERRVSVSKQTGQHCMKLAHCI